MNSLNPISGVLTYKNDKIHCIKVGNGKKLLIGFHGYASNANYFIELMHLLKDEYTLISLDLPGHGSTEMESKYFEPKALMALVQGIKLEMDVEKFSLIGHSMGGRVCLKIIELQPSWVEKAVLLATDGLKKNFWYNFATKNIFGKQLFNLMLKNPESFFKILKKLEKTKLIDKSRTKFVEQNLNNQLALDKLKKVWPVMSKLIPIPIITKWNIKKFKIETHIFVGKHDRIFKIESAEKFAAKQKNITLHILDAGHLFLNEKFIPQIAQSLL